MPEPTVAEILAKPYARVLMPDSNGWYAGQVEEFPGCFAQGETAAEAYVNLEAAAESWLLSALRQGLPIPEPHVSVGYSGHVALRLPKGIHRAAVRAAEQDGVSLNQFLVTAVAARVGAEDFADKLVKRIHERIGQIAGPQYLAMVGEARVLPLSIAPEARASTPPDGATRVLVERFPTEAR